MNKSKIINIAAEIPVDRIMNKLGYGKKAVKPHKKMTDFIQDEIENARSLIEFKVIYHKYPVLLKSSDIIDIDNQFHIESRNLFKFLKSSTRVYLMAITSGHGFEEHLTNLVKNGLLSRGIIADTIGSQSVEHAANVFHGILREKETGRKNSITGRFSPGYGDWRLEDQLILHKMVGTHRIGISLTERYMMVPQKSISAIIGVYPEDLVQYEKR